MNHLSTSKARPSRLRPRRGNSINAIVRMTGVAKHTVLKLIEDMGCACAAYRTTTWNLPNLLFGESCGTARSAVLSNDIPECRPERGDAAEQDPEL